MITSEICCLNEKKKREEEGEKRRATDCRRTPKVEPKKKAKMNHGTVGKCHFGSKTHDGRRRKPDEGRFQRKL